METEGLGQMGRRAGVQRGKKEEGSGGRRKRGKAIGVAWE